MDQAHEGDRPSAGRLAFISIAGFWLFYFAIASMRSAIVFGDLGGALAERIAITAFGALSSWLIHRVLGGVSTQKWGRSLLIAAVIALPTSAAFATLNWYLYDHVYAGRMQRAAGAGPAGRSEPASEAAAEASVSVSVGDGAEEPRAVRGAKRSIAEKAFNAYFFFVAWCALYLALRYATEVSALQRRAATLSTAAQAAELRALRYQVNPHFLFNTLNSLSSQVLNGRRDDAERMISNLATFFRTSLVDTPTGDVALSQELVLQRLYLDIESVRFPERLIVVFDVPLALEGACVPGLILQPLVENAVKHGVARTSRAVTIILAAREEGGRLILEVMDDGDTEAQGSVGSGIGLINVRDRLAARFGDKAACAWGIPPTGGFWVRLSMPLVRDGC